ncbi:secondary thiamine-phosphate synthase enzyme YjbQ [Leptonema illini]|nr:secondary thiamine-phosphate synthase enzyme YjbQ [Leptonema illini]
MQIFQTEISVTAPSRGFHLITGSVEKALREMKVRRGLLNLFLRHTSASLAINENADPDVRVDLEAYFRRAVPDGAPYFTHTLEGDDDMTAHIKSVLIGASLQIPIADGRPGLGTWQGIYLCEHRTHPSLRRILLTAMGE